MKYAVLNNFGARICNFMSDSSEIVSLIGRSEYKLSDIKGRALVSKDNVYLMQEFLPADISDAMNYRNRINEMVAAITANYNERAKAIPMLPEKLEFYDLLQRKDNNRGIALGLDNEDVSVRYLTDASPFLIVGTTGTGKTNMLKVIYNQVKSENVFLVDSRSEDFYDVAGELCDKYLSKESEIDEFMDSLGALIEEREKLYENSGKTMKSKDFYAKLEPAYLLIDDVTRLSQMKGIEVARNVSIFEAAIMTGINIVATIDGRQGYTTNSILKIVKNTVDGIILGNPQSQQVFNISGGKLKTATDLGFIYSGGSMNSVKIPLIEN